MTVKELIENLQKLPEDFQIKSQVIREIPEDELDKMSYKFPYEFIDANLDIADIGYSDKIVKLTMSI